MAPAFVFVQPAAPVHVAATVIRECQSRLGADSGISTRLPIMLSVLVILLMLATSQGYSEPLVGIDWIHSLQTSMREKGIDGHTKNLEYSKFSWHIGHQWRNRKNASEMILGLQYTRRTFQGYGPFGLRGDNIPENLYSLEMITRWKTSWGNTQETLLFISPVLESAAENTLKPRDFKFAGGGLVLRQFRIAQLGVGFAWSRVFGKAMLLPLGAINWQSPHEKIIVRLLLPLEGEVRADLRPWLTVGLVARQQGSEYRTDDQDTEGDQWIQHRSTTMGPAAIFHLGTSNLHLFTRSELVFAHQLNTLDKTKAHTDRDVARTWMIHAGFLFGIPTLSGNALMFNRW